MKNAKGKYLEGLFHLNENAGDPVEDVTELHYKVNDERLGHARHELLDVAWLMPGRSTRVLLTFVRPDPMLPSLCVGREVDAYRGTRKIGTLHITGVSSPPLEDSTAVLGQNRLEPQSPALIRITILISVVYSVFTVLTVYLAAKAYAPCESNFEGGCSMGRAMMAIVSLMSAAAAFILGMLVKRLRDRFFAVAPRMVLAHSLLWVAPLVYILITLYAMFR
ncbi:hypothetical protein [Massilia sp. 9I]|uniref:hypothetical protein n=1 Tax=Massilia sp. 9I TaxID=2653152 RepID=UPI0012F45228|nr:hypothetical protein [Massilia sp. 9I]VXC26265.1 membrane hypothetical protein [Massilia sp. 9I]